MPPGYHITTLGCPKNQADSREIEASLRRQGFVAAVDLAEADLHIINSCAFIEAARVETIQTVMEAAALKRERPDQRLVLAGCFAQRYSTAVREEMPEVDFSFGTGLYHRAGELVAERFGWSGAGAGLRTPSLAEFLPERYDRPYAAVKISDGCNRGCAFCAIPLFRGEFRDRPVAETLAECRALAAGGVREVMLVSQDTNQFGGGAGQALVDLVAAIAEIEGIHWIRLLYLYPDARTERLLRQLAEGTVSKLVPYLESPVQHVSASVLRAMRRARDADRYADLFALARELFPGLEIRSSFLVGFPGETEADVLALVEFLKRTRLEKLAVFTYSPEEGAPGFSLGDPIPEEEKARRANFVRREHLGLLKELHRERVGRSYRCMVDRSDTKEVVARRAQDAPEADESIFLRADAALRPGDLIDVEIDGFFEYDMSGRLLARTGA